MNITRVYTVPQVRTTLTPPPAPVHPPSEVAHACVAHRPVAVEWNTAALLHKH